MNIETLTTFFAWLTVINIGVLLFTTMMVVVLRGWASCLHARMFDLDPAFVRQQHYQYLANFKIVTIVFCLAPYIALRIIG